MAKVPVKGTLEVICGSMFSGKSEELIRRVRRSEIAHAKTMIFKHKVDDRMSIEYVHSHNGDRIKHGWFSWAKRAELAEPASETS